MKLKFKNYKIIGNDKKKVWQQLLHRSDQREGFEKTKEAIAELLPALPTDITDITKEELIKNWIDDKYLKKEDTPKEGNASTHAQDIISEFGRTFVTYFKKPGVWLAIVFMLLYRLPEAFLLKMVNPFLLDKRIAGGLELSTESVGFIYGTIGVFFLTIGGIIGGIAASRWGLKKSLWPMAACMTLPCFTFVYLSMVLPNNLWVIGTCVAIEQFGYGFGFTAYMLYMMYFSEGEFKTAHYAICTAFMALSMMLPGMVAGYLQEWLGYEHFFWMVIVCCIATVLVTFLIKVNPEYGRKKA